MSRFRLLSWWATAFWIELLTIMLLIGAFFTGAEVLAQTADNRLTLLVFKDPICDPCKAWKAAYEDPRTGLCIRINRLYRMKNAMPVKDYPELAQRYGIRVVPTFLLTDSAGHEVHRVERFNSPAQLLRDLAKAPRARNRSTAPTLPIQNYQPTVPERNPINEQLQSANQTLQEQQDLLRGQIRDMQKYAESQRQRAEAANSRLTQERAKSEKLSTDSNAAEAKIRLASQQMQSTETQIVELQRLLRELSSNNTEAAECKDGVCPLPTPNVPAQTKTQQVERKGILRKIFHHGVQLGVDVGFTHAQTEILVPIAAASGPIGIAAVSGFMLFRAWRRRKRRSASRSPGTTVVVDGPSPPAKERIDTQFVNVESDSYRAAHEKARQQVARRYPGSQEILEAELSLTHQFLAGQS